MPVRTHYVDGRKPEITNPADGTRTGAAKVFGVMHWSDAHARSAEH
jgi:hypothetical protein